MRKSTKRQSYISDEKIRHICASVIGVDLFKEPEWNGAGLPPVGAACECDWTEWGRYAPAVVRFIGSMLMIVECEGVERVVYVENAREQLRPIRTQAQREREELISAATEILNQDHVLTERDAAEALYDAGMLRGAGE